MTLVEVVSMALPIIENQVGNSPVMLVNRKSALLHEYNKGK